MTPRVFHQNAPHQLGRNGKKMSAILPLPTLVIDEPHVGLVYKGCGLPAVTGALATHVAAGEAVEFVINDGGQPVERGSISVAPGSKQPAHFRI
jgi:hypothetical protein